MNYKLVLLPGVFLMSCASIKPNESRKLSRSAYYDWSISYNCGPTKFNDYYDPNQRLCKFWEVMDSGDYLFAESFINGMKDDNMEAKVVDLVRSHLLIRQGKIAEARELATAYKNEKYFNSLRVYLGIDEKIDQLGEYNQMDLLAKIKGNLRIGMTYEAWKLIKTLTTRTRDPWIIKQIEIFKSRTPGGKA